METSREGNDLEERYINVRRGGKRQAPPARKPQGRPRRAPVDYDDEFYDDPYYDDYDRGGYGGYDDDDDDYDYDYDPPPRKKSGHSGHGSGHAPAHKKHSVKRPRSPLGRLCSWLYRLIVVLSAMIVVGYGAVKFAIRPPEVPSAPDQSTAVPDVSADTSSGSDVSVPADPSALVRREGVYNILLAGTDRDGFRTDTMMVFSYDVPNQKVGVVSVPRDTIVDRGSGKNPKLVYGAGGVERRMKEISEILGVPVDHYIKVNLKGFIALVDYMGGVDFDVPCDMSYDDPYQNLSIHFKKGMQHLNGQQAMEVARFRKNNDGSGYTDVGRTQAQQDILVALAKKALAWNSLTKLNGFVDIFNKYVDTDLSTTEMLYFASQAIHIDPSSDVETCTLQGNGEAHYRGFSYCYALDPTSTLEAVNRLVNPYTRKLTLEDMNLLQGS